MDPVTKQDEIVGSLDKQRENSNKCIDRTENGCRLVAGALFCRSMTCVSLTLLVQCEPEERCLKDGGRNQFVEVSLKVNIAKMQTGCRLLGSQVP